MNYLTSGPIVALELLGDHAITRWQEVMGPEDPREAVAKAPSSLRACYGKDNIVNAVYGSDNEETAEKVCYSLMFIIKWCKYLDLFLLCFFPGITIFLP